MADGKFVAYYRVSTTKQGESRLGLDAQRKAVEDYLNGGNWQLVDEFTEIESGKSDKNRPQLHAALAICRKQRATLVIAKLDRLARNVAYIATLMEAKVPLKFVDMPDADTFRLHIEAVLAEEERRRIGSRTKAALAAAKARGVQLGKHGRVMGPRLARQNKADAEQFARRVAGEVEQLRRQHPTVRTLTDAMNAADIPTASGGNWHPATVHRLLKRLDALDG